MSGGHFNYGQYKIRQIADEMEQLIYKSEQESKYIPEVIEKFKKALSLLRESLIYVQRIDWLVSDDDSPETFLKRLETELSAASIPISINKCYSQELVKLINAHDSTYASLKDSTRRVE